MQLDSPDLTELLVDGNASPPWGSRRALFAFAAVQVLLTAGLLVYSQTMGFVWDEGFHLVAAKLIAAGKRPYIDFCFPQTPLNAYWNAIWLRVLGESWRVTHVVAALLVSAAAYLISDYIVKRLAIPGWRLAGATLAACLVALNESIVQFGVVAQAYGAGLFLVVAAFRVVILSVGRASLFYAALAGLLAGAAAASTLLTAPVLPVMLLWILIYNRTGSRFIKLAAYLLGALIPSVPILLLLIQGPAQTWFNVVQYQALFRRSDWPGATSHDVEVLTAWLNSTETSVLALLALAGVFFVKKSSWRREVRAEFYLCGWLTLALVLYISTPHPTFTRYFLFAVPFAAVLAIPGLYWFTSRLGTVARPARACGLTIAFLLLYVGRLLFLDRDATIWRDYEQVAAKVNEVTPRGGRIYADELVYFLLNRPIPSGMEFSYSHKLQLPPKQEALLHIVSERELNEQVKRGEFATVQSCNDDRIEELKLADLFPYKAELNDCSVYWGPVRPLSK